MPDRLRWSRWQLLVAFALYCRLPFGKLHRGNPEIIRFADAIGRTPSSLAMKLTNFASLDPVIVASGRVGLRSASNADRAMWEEMNTDPDYFMAQCQTALSEADGTIAKVLEPEEEAGSTDYFAEDRLAQTNARNGQRFFREAVLSSYGERCCITGLSIPKLLVASHIVPWRVDKFNRLNPRNGLALSVLHDRAFDAGLITINEDLTIRVSRDISAVDDAFLKASVVRYDGQPLSPPQKFGVGKEFLAYHRKNIFQD